MITELFAEREIFQTKFTEYIKTHILRSITFSESRAFYEAKDDNVIRRTKDAMCMRDN